jgi:hypothetical protein
VSDLVFTVGEDEPAVSPGVQVCDPVRVAGQHAHRLGVRLPE